MEIWFNPPVQNILIDCINFPSCTITQNALLPTIQFWRTLHICPHKTHVLKFSSQEVEEGVLTLHIHPWNWCAYVSKSRGGGYWHYTYPLLNWCTLVSNSRVGEGVLTLHITPPLNWCAHVSKSRGGGGDIDITHTPLQNWCACLHVKRWGVLTLHIQPPNWCAQVSKSRGGGIDITHTPPSHQTEVLKSPCQEVGGIDITHNTPPLNWCACLHVKRWGYWHYSYSYSNS